MHNVSKNTHTRLPSASFSIISTCGLVKPHFLLKVTKKSVTNSQKLEVNLTLWSPLLWCDILHKPNCKIYLIIVHPVLFYCLSRTSRMNKTQNTHFEPWNKIIKVCQLFQSSFFQLCKRGPCSFFKNVRFICFYLHETHNLCMNLYSRLHSPEFALAYCVFLETLIFKNSYKALCNI